MNSLPDDSRVLNWIGSNKSDWAVSQIGQLCREVRTKNIGLVEETVLSLSYGRVIIKPPEKLRGLIPETFETYQVLRPGDIVIRPTDLQNDHTSLRVGQTNSRGIITSAYMTLRPRAGISSKFLFRVLSAYDFMKVFYGYGSGLRQNLNFRHIKHVPVRIPDIETQGLIVRYLDNVELHIQRAIAAKTRLLSLLRERRQVIIEQHVVRGNLESSSGRLVESGIPWLGAIPADWDLTPFRELFRPQKIVVGNRSSSLTLLSLTRNGVIIRDLSQMKGKFPSSFDTYQEVHEGDLVMCLFDVEETPRTVGLSPHHGMITGAYDVFKPIHPDPDLARFAELQLLTIDDAKRFKPLYKGLRKVVPARAIAGARLAIPPSDQIRTILQSVDSSVAATDAAIRAAQREIELLHEYRTRLISDVVTGRRDIREQAAAMKDVDPAQLQALDGANTEVGDGDESDE